MARSPRLGRETWRPVACSRRRTLGGLNRPRHEAENGERAPPPAVEGSRVHNGPGGQGRGDPPAPALHGALPHARYYCRDAGSSTCRRVRKRTSCTRTDRLRGGPRAHRRGAKAYIVSRRRAGEGRGQSGPAPNRPASRRDRQRHAVVEAERETARGGARAPAVIADRVLAASSSRRAPATISRTDRILEGGS